MGELGENVLAIHAQSPLVPVAEQAEAERFAAALGCAFLSLPVPVLDLSEFATNPPDRCYHCKKYIYTSMLECLAEKGDYTLLDGTNFDDLHSHRPGLAALAELGVNKPLADAYLSKDDVRVLSKKLGLPTWNKYSASCLATRISHGLPITLKKIERVARCENFLNELDYHGVRVRLESDGAIVELQEDDIDRFAKNNERSMVCGFFEGQGVDRVSLCLRGRSESGK